MSNTFLPTDINNTATLFIKEFFVPEEDVSPSIQLIISDLIYMVFYGSQSTVRNLLKTHQLDTKTARTSIINDFNKVIHNNKILAAHSAISTAKIDVTDIHVSAGTLYVTSTITVTPKDKNSDKISKQVSVTVST